MSVVRLERFGRVAVIRVDNPPVNAISAAVRQGILAALGEAEGDGGITAIVLAAAGRTFMAGADITEFGKPPAPPSLPELVEALEASAKPVVAALHGTALGGGLELALGCHYRVAASTARLGLPEVTLGLIPGAGGTQRLPRLVGVGKALDIIVSGKPIGAREALESGMIDALADGDPLEAALAFAGQTDGPRRLSQMPVPTEGAAPEDFAAFRESMKKRTRGFTAPERAIRAIEAAVALPCAEGVKRERELFMECLADPQSAALRHAFFAERATARVPGIDKTTPRREIASIGVIGGGTMGAGIALACLAAGFPVTVLEQTAEAEAAARARMSGAIDAALAKGRIDAAMHAAQLGRMATARDIAALGGADLVIEAVFERMDIKQEVFRNLDAVAKPGAILATNTSYLDINAIAGVTSRPQDVLGLHFFSPANIMKLLEIVRTGSTAPEVLASALDMAKRLGKTAVVAGVCRGFIGNRMLQGYAREAGLLLLDGASPSEVDRAMTDFGFAMGPFAVSDLAGIDIGWLLRKDSPAESFDPLAFRVHDRLVEAGRKGQKTGAGFYDYASGRAEPSAAVEAIIREEAAKAGIARRAVGAAEIVERCLLPLINEGAGILEEGIASRASDIDVVWLAGYGFPRWRGGPMYHADQLGLGHVFGRIEHWRKRLGARWWTPAPLLERLAREGRGFSDLGPE